MRVNFAPSMVVTSTSRACISDWISLATLVAGIWLMLSRRHAPKLTSAV